MKGSRVQVSDSALKRRRFFSSFFILIQSCKSAYYKLSTRQYHSFLVLKIANRYLVFCLENSNFKQRKFSKQRKK